MPARIETPAGRRSLGVRILFPLALLALLAPLAAPPAGQAAPGAARLDAWDQGASLLDDGRNAEAAELFARLLRERVGGLEAAEGFYQASTRLGRPDSALAGLNAVEAETLAFYRALGMSRRQLFRIVRLPAALPYCFSGLRMAATYGVMGAVIGEWLGASAGLGLLLTRAQRSYDLPLSFAAIAAIVVESALLCGAVILIERRCLRWRYVSGDEWRD